MREAPSGRWLRIEPHGEVAVVHFLQPRILDEEVIDHVGHELARLVAEEECRRMVLDFSQVAALATHMLGELLAVHKKMQAAGGRLALCGFQPSLREVFEILKLSSVFHLFETRDQALRSFGPSEPGA